METAETLAVCLNHLQTELSRADRSTRPFGKHLNSAGQRGRGASIAQHLGQIFATR
jgi:hypothetical protein